MVVDTQNRTSGAARTGSQNLPTPTEARQVPGKAGVNWAAVVLTPQALSNLDDLDASIDAAWDAAQEQRAGKAPEAGTLTSSQLLQSILEGEGGGNPHLVAAIVVGQQVAIFEGIEAFKADHGGRLPSTPEEIDEVARNVQFFMDLHADELLRSLSEASKGGTVPGSEAVQSVLSVPNPADPDNPLDMSTISLLSGSTMLTAPEFAAMSPEELSDWIEDNVVDSPEFTEARSAAYSQGDAAGQEFDREFAFALMVRDVGEQRAAADPKDLPGSPLAPLSAFPPDIPGPGEPPPWEPLPDIPPLPDNVPPQSGMGTLHYIATEFGGHIDKLQKEVMDDIAELHGMKGSGQEFENQSTAKQLEIKAKMAEIEMLTMIVKNCLDSLIEGLKTIVK